MLHNIPSRQRTAAGPQGPAAGTNKSGQRSP